MVSANISNMYLAFLGSLPYPPLSSKDAKLCCHCPKTVVICSVSIISTDLFWSVIKANESSNITYFVKNTRLGLILVDKLIALFEYEIHNTPNSYKNKKNYPYYDQMIYFSKFTIIYYK